MPAFAAVLFDMDGLLLDTEPLWDEVIDLFCQARGQRYTHEDAVQCRGRGIEQCARYLSKQYGFSGEISAQVDEIDNAFERRVGGSSPCVGAEDLLRFASPLWPCALGSSSTRPLINAALGPRGWLPLFHAIVTGSDVTRKKPDPDIYLACAEKLRVDITQCLVLEDSVVGCDAGRRAGAHVVGVGVMGDALLPFAHRVVTDLRVVQTWLSER